MNIRKCISMVLGSLVGAACIQLLYTACNNMNVDTPDASAQTADVMALAARVAALEGQVTTLQARPSVGRYCGQTAAANGAFGGYSSGRTLCIAACKNSQTAHMCTDMEIVNSLQQGIGVSTGWYATGVSAVVTSTFVTANDCKGWADGTTTQRGALWSQTYPSHDLCNVTYPILCCD